MEGSNRSAHRKAYFTGLLGAKRIVLLDRNQPCWSCENKAILAVSTHEPCHCKLGYIRMNIIIIIVEVQMFPIFSVFSQLFKYSFLSQPAGFSKNV